MGKSSLQGIVNGLLSTFVSRNNDIGGYWGLGVLRKLAESNGLDQIEIDLLCEDDETEAIESCKNRYRLWLGTNLDRNGRSLDSILSARIRLRFSSDFEAHPNAIQDTRGFPYECLVEVRCDPDRGYRAMKIGVCEPHDPEREYRRSADH